MNKIQTDVLQASNVVCSHLKANGIEATGDGNSIVTISHAGSQYQICVGEGYDAELKRLDISDLRSNRTSRIQQAFNKLKEFTGIDVPITTTHRAPDDGWKKGTLKNNFEAVLFREKTFRNAPNPDPVLFKKFDPIALRHAQKIFYRYRKHMLSFGYETEDFESLARIHLVTFLHRYMTGDVAEDTKNLNRFMKQRMTEVVYKILRKSSSCFADANNRVEWDFDNNIPRKQENHPG